MAELAWADHLKRTLRSMKGLALTTVIPFQQLRAGKGSPCSIRKRDFLSLKYGGSLCMTSPVAITLFGKSTAPLIGIHCRLCVHVFG